MKLLKKANKSFERDVGYAAAPPTSLKLGVMNMKIDKEDIIKTHDHSSNHYDEIMTSEICGCFYCQKTYKPSEIKEWIDVGTCAICPKCGIDSVIGSASGFPITQDFLGKMCDHWFSAAS